MNIKRVKYKMTPYDDWKVGYVIGSYDGQKWNIDRWRI